MRTTVEFDDDTAMAIESLRRERGIGVSEAVNELIRLGMLPRAKTQRFRQRTRRLGIALDVSNIGQVLEELDGVGTP